MVAFATLTGVVLGMIIGAVTDQLGVWLALGIGFGTAVGGLLDATRRGRHGGVA